MFVPKLAVLWQLQVQLKLLSGALEFLFFCKINIKFGLCPLRFVLTPFVVDFKNVIATFLFLCTSNLPFGCLGAIELLLSFHFRMRPISVNSIKFMVWGCWFVWASTMR